MEITQIPVKREMGKETVGHLHHGILLFFLKGQNPIICSNGGHCAFPFMYTCTYSSRGTVK